MKSKSKDKSKSKYYEKTRINLLPQKDKERLAKNRKRITVFLVIGGYIMFIILLDLGYVMKNNAKKSDIFNLREELSLIKTKNTLNETLESAIDKKRALLASIQNKIAIINELEKLKTPLNKDIGLMVEASPKGVWMSGLSLQNGIVSINGNSISLNGISVYIKRLKETGLFQKISLSGASRKIISGNTFYSFELLAAIKYSNENFSIKK